MKALGKINEREIFYLSVRNNSEWSESLPVDKWIAFTIADEKDEAIFNESVTAILKKHVAYICSAGELGELAEEYFDEEIVWQGAQSDEKSGTEYDYEQSPVTTSHEGLEEGLWFASSVAKHTSKAIDQVVCIDFTERNLKKYLTDLIQKLNP